MLKFAALRLLNCTLILKTKLHYPAFHSASPSLLTNTCAWVIGATEKEDFNFWEPLGKMLLPLKLFSSIKLKVLGVGVVILLSPSQRNYI